MGGDAKTEGTVTATPTAPATLPPEAFLPIRLDLTRTPAVLSTERRGCVEVHTIAADRRRHLKLLINLSGTSRHHLGPPWRMSLPQCR